MQRTTPRTLIFGCVATLWVGVAVLLATLPSAFGRFGAVADPLLLLGLLVCLGVSINLQFEFTIRRHSGVFSPFVTVLVLAAMLLPPLQAIAVVLLGSLLDIRSWRGGVAGWKIAVNAATDALTAGSAAVILHPYSPPGPELWLVFALVGSVLVEFLNVVALATLFELHTPGMARAFLSSARTVAWFDAALATVSTTLVLPFASSPLVLCAVLFGVLAITRIAAHISTSENLHRMKNQHLRDVFGRMVPAHVADQLAEDGSEVALGGEQREVSVLFCDIRGFTSWSEHESPEVVITQLNELLGGLSGAVMNGDGTLDKYTGDGLMAFWGAPLDQPDHAERACRAAIDMIDRLQECNAARADAGYPPFAIGIGVHSGTAVVGNIGHEQRLDYTAIGDTVNLAARLESATKELGSPLVVSQATRALLPLRLQAGCIGAGSITVKGRTQPVDVFALDCGWFRDESSSVSGGAESAA